MAQSPAATPHLRVTHDQRALETAEGQPFLWLADTGWELFHRTTREEADLYLRSRAGHGFTVVMATALAENDGLRVPNRYGDLPLHELDPARPNERYFAHVDWIVDRAAQLGLVVGFLPTWGDKVPNLIGGDGPVIFTPANALAYGRFLGARYRERPIVWVLGGDRNVDSLEVLEIWRAMARGLREGDGGRHLITFHPRGGTSSTSWVHNEPWLDFNSFQSAHMGRFHPVYRFAHLRLLHQPAKPIIEGEPAYEDIPIRWWEVTDYKGPQRYPDGVVDADGRVLRPEHFRDGFIKAHDVRVHGYWNLLSGAAGYSYGHNSIWQFWEPGRNAGVPTLVDWRTALEAPGARSMRWLRNVFTRFPPASFEPNQALLYGRYDEGPGYMVAALARDGRFGLAYAATGVPFSIHLHRLSGPQVTAEWFNPRNGTTQPAGRFPVAGIQTFTPPSTGPEEDWLLILQTVR